MSTNGLPPLPTPADTVTREITIAIPGDPPKILQHAAVTVPAELLGDLEAAAKAQGMDFATALVQCVALWRYPPSAPPARARARAKRA